LDTNNQIATHTPETVREERVLSGIGVAPGIAIGPAYLYAKVSFEVHHTEIESEVVEEEVERFENAVLRAERDLKKIIDVTRDKLGIESADIFEAQLLMLRDPALYDPVVLYIREHRSNAGFAVHTVMSKHRQVMESSDNEYLRERANDLLDLQDRLIRHLRRGRILSAIDSETIVIAENLTAADIILFTRRGILGCATDFGGETSHVSIMARALGLPSVVSMHHATDEIVSGETVIIDGTRGRIVVNPTAGTLKKYRSRQEVYLRLVQEEKQLIPLPSETKDGHRVILRANLELREEIELLKTYGAEGIGLFRTEILLLMESRISISEEEQYKVYRRVVEGSAPGITTFRVLDLGGDKLLPMAHREHNPFLGWRGIRVMLDKPDILLPQLRAMLRAGVFGPIRILIPMVTNLNEVTRFRDILRKTRADLESEGIPCASLIPVGVMIEVPSVALLSEQFAEAVDFFSIGTNDLTQYVLAVDRGNDLVSELYDDMHPAVLRLINTTIESAGHHGIPVGICGQLASNPLAVPILIGLGIHSLSASPVYLPRIKRVVRAVTQKECRILAKKVLQITEPREVRAYMEKWLEEHGCGTGADD
jgi:phosphoenolpyruvate-protein phosphotransferase (PTS system enzyme I)